MASYSQEGRVALVTAAGRGVGRGVSKSLAEVGAVVAVNDIEADYAKAVATEIVAAGGKAIAAPFDVRDREQVRRGVQEIEGQVGPIEILVNCAGGGVTVGGGMGRFKDADPAIWRKWLDLDLCGSLNTLHTVLPGMVERGWGRVVQISSGAGSRGHTSGIALYGAAKAGIEAALRHIAMEEAKSGVTLNSVALGIVSNNAGREHITGGAGVGTLGGVPMGRMVEPSEIGACAVWLTSDLAAAVTGQVIHVNCGSHQGR